MTLNIDHNRVSDRGAIVITTVSAPTEAIRSISSIAGWIIIVVGDSKTPAAWHLPNVTFLSLDQQLHSETSGRYAAACPIRHYARKNVGYLHAMSIGATVIAETDDDNLPYDSFPGTGERYVYGRPVTRQGWENVYRHFTSERIWPRGFPLEFVRDSFDGPVHLSELGFYDCAIHQYLADGDPDVDAVHRLTIGLELSFSGDPVVLSDGVFCPFNSQNTVWWPEAYPLLYLPSYASFRMTDIWRSFVAQTCLYAIGGRIAFCSPTVYQDRNKHSLLHDFELEIPGYLHNAEIIQLLSELPLSGDSLALTSNLRICYEALVRRGLLPDAELTLLDYWVDALPATYRAD